MKPERWRQVEQLCEAALKYEGSERAVFLREACGEDEALLRQVKALLSHEDQAKGFIETPAMEWAAQWLVKNQPESVNEVVSRDSFPMMGQTVSHYRIIEKLGAGGMGEVYRADDTNLNRQVAIKVLPEAFSRDLERLTRFEREAKLLGSLNHPNIAAIYGLEQADSQRFLVLELVEGDTLAEWLGRGPLPIEAALGVCRQIAEGVEAAHEKGVIHRDLKPANIKITPEGKVKILDFGVAKAFQKEGSAPELSKSPTLTDEMTGPGVILGTAAYMSPEQANGKAVDKRTDIWGFGCVLFECLAGKRAFGGETVSETLAAILKGEPDWQALPAMTPLKVKDLLHRCLQKDPRERLHDIADARIEIGESLGPSAEGVAVSQRYSLRWLAVGAAIILLAGILMGRLLLTHPEATSQSSVVRSVVKFEPGHRLDGKPWLGRPGPTDVEMSRDGRFIVYGGIVENPGPQAEPQLYLRRTDQLEAKPISGTDGGTSPFLSPDDRWLGFWADGKLMKISLDGGLPVTLCDAGLPFGASWGRDNSIVFSPNFDLGLFRISADGGKPEILTTPDKTKEESSHRLPHCLPDGKGVLFTIMRESLDLRPRIALLDLKTRKWNVLMEDAADARYVPTGHLAFLRQGTLMRVLFDLDRREVTGQPVPAIANVAQALNISSIELNTAAGQFSISDSGWLVYAVGGIRPDGENSLVWMDQKGNPQPVASFKAPFGVPRLSPDGQRIAYGTYGRESRVWVYDLTRGTASRLTGEGRTDRVTWTPDGKRVVFGWWRSGRANLFWQPADGSSPMERLTTSDYAQQPGSFSPDGTTLAFVEYSGINCDILLLDIPSRRVTPFLDSRAFEGFPEFSPDGRWLAYVSDETGRDEVYVRLFPGPGGKWQISPEGGTHPLWARNGKQLFYRRPEDDQVWAVDIRAADGFSAGKPRILFDAPGLGSGLATRTWDVSLDGQRFLMVKVGEIKPTPVTELVLVQNWFEELKRLAPAGKK